ncbi:MAG: phosphate ABC transporter permease PstA, partial [Bacteriovoracaceae bacterium]
MNKREKLEIRGTIRNQRRIDKGFSFIAIASMTLALVVLVALVANLAVDGLPRLSWDFLTSFPSRFAYKAGILSAWVGTILVMFVTAFVAVPLGVAAGIYLEEYAPKNRFTTFIEISISNLAGVPSIVFGLMALGLFVYKFNLGQSVATAGLTLALLILPIIIVTTREAIRTIPVTVREAAYALGASKWEVVKDQVVPSSMGG